MAKDYMIDVDGNRWNAVSNQANYDTIHVVAGAILAGADEIHIESTEHYAYDE